MNGIKTNTKWLCGLILLLVTHCPDLAAQKKKTFKIKPGEKLVEKVPREDMYSHPDFAAGTVYLRNNTYSPARLSYNTLFGEMQFLGTAGDTISLADENNIRVIIIGADTFYYSSNAYLEQVLDKGEVKLANRKLIVFLNREKLNGFGESSGGSIDTYGALSSKAYLKELVASEIITLQMTNTLYIGDQFNYFREVNKKNLLDFYSKKEKEVEKYLKENKVNYSNKDQLIALINHFGTGE